MVNQSTSNQFECWFTAANFCNIQIRLRVVRAESAIVNAGANSGISFVMMTITEASFATGQGSHGEWAASTAGTWGNSMVFRFVCYATMNKHWLTHNSVKWCWKRLVLINYG